MNTYTLLY